MDSTTEIYFNEIIENFIKLVQAVNDVGDKVQKKRLSEKRDQLCQVISLIEPERKKRTTKNSNPDSSKEKDEEGKFFSKVTISLVISTIFEFSRQKLDTNLLENGAFRGTPYLKL